MERFDHARGPRFDAFEVNLRSGELHKHGIRLKLQDQPFEVLALLLEHPGEVVTREELRQKLWPADCFVDFDTGLNNAIRKLRDALGDSAGKPRYIETLPRRGYRFIARVENGNGAMPASTTAEQNFVPALTARAKHPLWNKRRIFVAGAAAALLVVAAIAAWRIFLPRPALAGSDAVVLASFVNKTNDPAFDNALDKALEVKLAESSFLSLFPEADVHATLGMMRHDTNERVTRELGIEICNRQGLKAVVVPEIAAVGSKYLITLEAIDARSQKSIARQQTEAENKDQVFAAVGDAGLHLRQRLGERLSSLEKYDAPLDFATTSSFEALQAYRTGLMQFRFAKPREAIALFERAVELDPQFCSAYRMLGNLYASVGDGQASRKNFVKAFELKDGRLTQEESLLTSAVYHMNVSGDYEKAMAALVLYRQAYPRSTVAYNLLGLLHSRMGQTEEALGDLQAAIRLGRVPAAPDSSNASRALMVMGRFKEAKSMLEQWRLKGPLNPSQAEQLYRIAFLENDVATMERLARETPADDASWLALQEQLAFFRGDTGRLRSLSEAALNQQKRAQRMENAANELAWHALLESYLGNHSLARTLCRQSSAANRDSSVALTDCAKAFAVAGDVTQAEEWAERIDRLRPEDTLNHKIHLPLIRSIIERQKGDTAKAVDLLDAVAQYEQGQPEVLYHRGEAYLAHGEAAKAATEFEEVIAHRGWPSWAVFAPLAQLGLARSYTMEGDREKSRKAYDNFFTAWRDADAEVPTLREAKAEYARLNASVSANASASEQEL